MSKYYEDAVKFSSNENNKKDDIFIFTNQNKDDINIILGILDGLILRHDDSFFNGFIKQFKHLLSEDDIALTLEHACLYGKEHLVKILVKLITNSDLLLDIHSYVKSKSNEYASILEKYIDKNIFNKQIKETDNTIINNITIENLTLNMYNINLDSLDDNIYFNRITRRNNINNLLINN